MLFSALASSLVLCTTLRTFHVPIKPGLPLIFADRDRVAEVLANLCDNADKYSPPGAEILIDVRADQTTVTIAVCDMGRGIRDVDRKRIFDKFYRAKPAREGGVGLGLTICRGIIEAHEGRIWAENRSGGGTIVRFSIPLPDQQPAVAMEQTETQRWMVPLPF